MKKILFPFETNKAIYNDAFVYAVKSGNMWKLTRSDSLRWPGINNIFSKLYFIKISVMIYHLNLKCLY